MAEQVVDQQRPDVHPSCFPNLPVPLDVAVGLVADLQQHVQALANQREALSKRLVAAVDHLKFLQCSVEAQSKTEKTEPVRKLPGGPVLRHPAVQAAPQINVLKASEAIPSKKHRRPRVKISQTVGHIRNYFMSRQNGSATVLAIGEALDTASSSVNQALRKFPSIFEIDEEKGGRPKFWRMTSTAYEKATSSE